MSLVKNQLSLEMRAMQDVCSNSAAARAKMREGELRGDSSALHVQA